MNLGPKVTWKPRECVLVFSIPRPSSLSRAIKSTIPGVGEVGYKQVLYTRMKMLTIMDAT